MEKEKVVAAFLLAVGDVGVGDGYLAAAFLVGDGGAVASEVEEVPWPG